MTKTNAADPQNDRELFFQLNGKIGELIVSVDHLTNTFKEWKTTEFARIELEVQNLLTWKNQEVGKWKAITIGVAILTLVSLYLAIRNATK